MVCVVTIKWWCKARGMLETLSLIHCVKLFQPLSKYARDLLVSASNRSFLTTFQIHGCKEILLSLLQDKKTVVSVLLYVFIIEFPAWRCVHGVNLVGSKTIFFNLVLGL